MKSRERLVLLASAGASNALLNCSTEAFKQVIPANATVVLAQRVAENGTFTPPSADTGFPNPAYMLPALCAVQIEMPTEANTTFNFGLFLPDDWEGRMVVSGNSAFSGGVNYAEMGAGVTYGSVAMSTDTGHDSAFDNSWAENAESITDWGWRAMHYSVVEAKKVIKAYYGSALKYSYYNGCSTGGRQGLKEVQAFPDDFDGAVVGAPAWWTTHLQLFNIYSAEYNLPDNSSHYLSSELLEFVANETLKQCVDPQDGVTDNIISDPRRCDLNLEAMLCNSNFTSAASNSYCLNSAQIDTLYHYYNDWVEADQTFIFPHYEIGSETGWGQDPDFSYIEYFLGLGTNFTWADWNADIVKLSDEMNPGNATAGDFDLSPFYEKGSKIIHYHGMADPSIPTGSSVYYYKHVQRILTQKGIDLDDFYRFYLIPGMEHCGNTPSNMEAPWYIGGSSQASTIGTDGSGNHLHEREGFNDAKHDALLAMIAWVENGTAPTYLIGTKFHDESTLDYVEKQRPICPFPQQARYNESGSLWKPENWHCASLY
ncbi:feruloyl esterase B precursor [Aspergillus sclerotiicarbonarius CBS 121057]|uniref:Carboxylic ester hydrolase n=1 Tax=Aspergillus sclerotiicarbonarius (strain CBS 121057 / IBT 28362) TaxID=1448318 RepID=A0A319E521_ASPSB|nr:feruloyl esterase B precursor [Aspergillus sclerotiicarbonarius CBS 121057]